MYGDSYVQGDLDLPNRSTLSPPPSFFITATPGQLKRAGDEPTRGSPAFSALYADGSPAAVTHYPVFVSENFLNLDASYGWVEGGAMDPLTAAIKAAKAVQVDPGESRTRDESANTLRPITGRGFEAWKLRERSARDGKARRD